MKKNNFLILSILFLFLFGSCQQKFDNNGILSDGNFELNLSKKITYELPVTFRPNSPFTTIFFDTKTQREYITFGNDYAIDSLYFFDVLMGGKPIQVTPLNNPTQNIKGVFVISLDSILVVPKTERTIFLLDRNGKLSHSIPYKTSVPDSILNLTAPSCIYYQKTTQKIFFDVEINDWDFNEKSRFIAMQKFKKDQLKNPWLISKDNIFNNESDSISNFYVPNFYLRFINKEQTFFPLPFTLISDSNLLILSGYSDSIYVINHLNRKQEVKAYPIDSEYFDTIKCKPARLKKEEDAYTMDFLSSRFLNNSLSSVQYFEPMNCYLISVARKATKVNESGNPSQHDKYSGMLIYDMDFNKIGEFKFYEKGKFGITKSSILIKPPINKNSKNYDPRKIEMEVYSLSR